MKNAARPCGQSRSCPGNSHEGEIERPLSVNVDSKRSNSEQAPEATSTVLRPEFGAARADSRETSGMTLAPGAGSTVNQRPSL